MRHSTSHRLLHSAPAVAVVGLLLSTAACSAGGSTADDTGAGDAGGSTGSAQSGSGGASGKSGAAGKGGAATGGSATGGAGGGSGAGAAAGQGGKAGSTQAGGASGAGGTAQAGAGGAKAGAGGVTAGGQAGAAGGSTTGGAAGSGKGGAGGGGAAAQGGATSAGGQAGTSAGGQAGTSAGGQAGTSAGGQAGTSAGGKAGTGGAAGVAGSAGKGGCSADADCAGTGTTPQCCNNVCVNKAADTKNCGACGNVCPTPANTTATCDIGVCGQVCKQGFSSCDKNDANGCEVAGDCACNPGDKTTCYEGPGATLNVGLCKSGEKTCKADGTGFGPCVGQVLPANEVCDGLLVDENCNGTVNEGGQDPACVCTPGSTSSCYTGPAGTANVGLCKSGTQTCLGEGTGYGPCLGEVVPATEQCAPGNTTDEDCDGQVNEGGTNSQGCVCTPGAAAPCYDGIGGLASSDLTAPNGTCKAGTKVCAADGAGYGSCVGQVLPAAEICDNTLKDENCNGVSNEGGAGCQCTPGAVQPCWEGPPSAVFGGTSICVKGTQTCMPQGTWGSCLGQTLPNSEPVGACTANIDEDCDGDPLGPGAVDADGDGWTPCGGDCCDVQSAQCGTPGLVNPGAYDVTGNDVDDDCDGTKDNAVAVCDSGLASNSANPLDYAKAIDLCQFTTESPPMLSLKKWGVISAQLLRADGTAAPAPNSRSIRTGFGDNITPKKGTTFAVLSTGVAADRTDTNPSFASLQHGQDMGTTSGFPADWLAANGGTLPNAAGCPGIAGGATANDPMMLKLRIRVPTNAKSFSVASYFMSAEYPEWVCSPFNDFFVALLDSSFSGTPANPVDKNLAFYDPPPAGGTQYPVGVNLAYLNNGLFRACKNGTMACAWGNNKAINTCTGNTELAGTGFDIAAPANVTDWERCLSGDQIGGGTGYLYSSGNVVPGETIEIRFAVWDTSDHGWDSSVILDSWSWSLDASTPGTVINPPGGT